MDELKNEINDVSFLTIDVDAQKEEAMLNNVSSVPTIIILKDGKEMHRFTGVKPKSVIKTIIENFK
jgi:thioredoxin 1